MKKYLSILFAFVLYNVNGATTNYLVTTTSGYNRTVASDIIPIQLNGVILNGPFVYTNKEDWGTAPMYFNNYIRMLTVGSVTNYIEWAVPYNVTNAITSLFYYWANSTNLFWTNEANVVRFTNTRLFDETITNAFTLIGTNVTRVTITNTFPAGTNESAKRIRIRYQYAPSNTASSIYLIGINQQYKKY